MACFTKRNFLKLWVAIVIGFLQSVSNNSTAAESEAGSDQPRIVNIYNFIRNSDFRLQDSQNVLFDCTKQQIELLKSAGLPATWALQYDALINPRYQKLLKDELRTSDEIAAWWEIPKQLAEKAGIKWRGEHDWDPKANVGFSPGYTPAERQKLVDVYMADFKSVFGRYPRTVGSWFIDEVTLSYMTEKYDIVASCNCKDQIGTDFYTLWGGYWNQAYYPSRVNSYMPAQTRAGQINVPIFRMLGSDPIYQHGTTPGLQSLEPVYKESGGSPKWVEWFLNNLVEQPCLAFGYTQAGQENSFGWDAMRKGLTNQVAVLAAMAKAGKIHVETLEQSGEWFRQNFSLTPATAVVALDDWKEQGRKTVWYDSRFYRLNILWEKNSFFIRDIHCFDERIVSPTHETPLKATSLAYETLPIVDWARNSQSGKTRAGMWPVLLKTDGSAGAMQLSGAPIVKELNATDLSIVQPLRDGDAFTITCTETNLVSAATNAQGGPLKWRWELESAMSAQRITSNTVFYTHSGNSYQLALDSGSCQKLENGTICLIPDAKGEIILNLNLSK